MGNTRRILRFLLWAVFSLLDPFWQKYPDLHRDLARFGTNQMQARTSASAAYRKSAPMVKILNRSKTCA
ncbi:MAG: hypothetical protein ACJA06_001131 [Halocynthiibacter sp.]